MAESLESSERTFGIMGGLLPEMLAQSEILAKMVAPMAQMVHEMSGYIVEVQNKVAVERGAGSTVSQGLCCCG